MEGSHTSRERGEGKGFPPQGYACVEDKGGESTFVGFLGMRIWQKKKERKVWLIIIREK